MSEPVLPFPSDVTVAVVAHDSAATLPGVLEAIAAAGCPEVRLTVVDVASTDGGVAAAAAARPAMRVHRLDANDGPNPGRNVALAEAGTRYVLLMDADVLLDPAAAPALRAAMTDPDVAVAVPLVVHASRPETIQYGGGGLHYICEAVNDWSDRPVAERGLTRADVGAAPGCALLIDRDAARVVDGFDERYFMGKEDGDFLHRLRIAGYRLVEVPEARVLHHSRPRSTWLYEYQIRNRWHFLLRSYELRTLIVLFPALALHEVLQFAALAAGGHAGPWARALRALGRLLPALPADRAAVARYRRAGDGRLLRSDPLVVRADIAGGAFKRAYDGWLRFYWRLARPLLDTR